MKVWLQILIPAFTLLAPALAAQQKPLMFYAQLAPTATSAAAGSAASGTAIVGVDLVKQVISLDLQVKGIALDGLRSDLVKAPIGPIHLHLYRAANLSGESVGIILAMPYGPAYKKTKTGFRVILKNHDYAVAAQLVKSPATIQQFAAALQSAAVVLNIHTNQHNDGEISGVIYPLVE